MMGRWRFNQTGLEMRPSLEYRRYPDVRFDPKYRLPMPSPSLPTVTFSHSSLEDLITRAYVTDGLPNRLWTPLFGPGRRT